MGDSFNISWVIALPPNNLLEKSAIYIVKPSANSKPNIFVTNADASEVYHANPDTVIGDFLMSVNNIQGSGGNVDVDLVWNSTSGILSFTGGSQTVNLDARYVTRAEFEPWQTTTDTRITNLENVVTEGLKTPLPFDATQFASFPTATKGTTYKVTVAGTVSGVPLEIGDTIIYDADGNTPYVVQTNIDGATTTVRGIIRIATQAEVNENNVGNLNNESAVTPLTLHYKLINFLNDVTASQADVTAGTRNDVFVTPLTLSVELSALKASMHTHANKAVLDKFSEDSGGNLLYNGKGVYTLGASEW